MTTEMKIPKKVNDNYLWYVDEYYISQPFKLFGLTLFWKEPRLKRDYDSESALRELGFEPKPHKYDSKFYSCILPWGWTYKERGYWTDFYDKTGTKRISQFDKWAIYDSVHFVNFIG
jgi:hypothetical protein